MTERVVRMVGSAATGITRMNRLVRHTRWAGTASAARLERRLLLGLSSAVLAMSGTKESVGVMIWNAGAVTALALGTVAFGPTRDASGPTFNKEVAPILFKNCVNCHRSGGIASNVPLVSYNAARPWAKSIKEKVLTREMPPWPADPTASVRFRNDARLSQQDINTLVAWVNAGAPKGDDADLPPMPEVTEGWLHPKGLEPDLVIFLPGEFQAPATGYIPYLRYLAKVPVSEDKWIVASQARPGNPALVHHMAITEIALENSMTPADLDPFTLVARQLGFRNDLVGARPAVTDPSNPAVFDMLGVYTPGTTFEMYGDDRAKLLRGGKNLYIDFNIHYQATGKPEKDRSMIAFWFRPGPPKHQLFRVPGAGGTIIANGNELLTDAPGKRAEGTRVMIPPIPPYAENYEVTGVTAYTEPVTIYQFHPHAHLRAKDFKYNVVYPDGREETVLSVPKYDFGWQLAYELETPLKLPMGSKLVVTAHYDNSANNKYNPAPEKEVYFRDQNQSWDEMFTPFVQYTVDSQDLTKPPERQKQDLAEIAEVVGCLEQSSPLIWLLTNATDPVVSITQSTTSLAVKATETRSSGNRQYALLGVSVFTPSLHKGQRVAVKGVLTRDDNESRLNVTSLQSVAARCVN
jgi:hypothetical protein